MVKKYKILFLEEGANKFINLIRKFLDWLGQFTILNDDQKHEYQNKDEDDQNVEDEMNVCFSLFLTI